MDSTKNLPVFSVKDAESRIREAESTDFEDVTLEELKNEWLRASGEAGKANVSKEEKETARKMAKIARQKYFDALANK